MLSADLLPSGCEKKEQIVGVGKGQKGCSWRLGIL